MKFINFWFLILFVAGVVHARTYVVSPQGNDGNPAVAIIKESDELNLLRESIGKLCGNTAQNHLKKTMDSYFLGYQLWDNIATALSKSGFVLNSKIDTGQGSKKGSYKKEVMFFSKVFKN